MKGLLFSILILPMAVFAQDSTKHESAIPQPKEKSYYMVFSESVINTILRIIDNSDEPYATVRKPLKDLLIYEATHQPAADTSKIKKQ